MSAKTRLVSAVCVTLLWAACVSPQAAGQVPSVDIISVLGGTKSVTVDGSTRRGKRGFINTKGEMLIEPRFERAWGLGQGFAGVEYDGKRAVIDKLGRVIWETEMGWD